MLVQVLINKLTVYKIFFIFCGILNQYTKGGLGILTVFVGIISNINPDFYSCCIGEFAIYKLKAGTELRTI